MVCTLLSKSVSAVDAEVGTGDVRSGIGQQERERAHQVGGVAHLTLGDERGPLLLELRLVVEDLLGAVCALLLVIMLGLIEYDECKR